MFRSGFTLVSDAHIQAAMFNRTPVTVWMFGKIVDYGGVIESQSNHSVTINGEHYLKANCEFRVR